MKNLSKMPSKRMALLIYDGRDWTAFSFQRDAVGQLRETGSSASIPAGVMSFLRERKAGAVRMLLEGSVRRLETALPARLTFSEVSALLANEVAEQSGAEGKELVCAGGSGSVVGCSDPCMLCGAFDRQWVDSLHRQVVQAGLRFDGVGSLELACAAHWNAHRNREMESLILFGREHGFVLPARSLPNQPGPISLSGGLRQAERDPEAWRIRFVRGHRYLTNAGAVAVYPLGVEASEVVTILEAVEELPKPDYPDLDELLAGAARLAASGQANQLDTPVPIRNPHVLRRRFSHALIVIPCLLVLLSPLMLFWLLKWNLHVAKRQYQEVVVQFGPLEKRIEAAWRKKDEAQAHYNQAVALQGNLAQRRKPLFAFIHLAYFFSKYAGNTVRLESIADLGGSVSIRGIYTDPEDGLSLESALNSFTAERGLRILRNRVAERRDADGRVILDLEIDVDYQELNQ